MVDREMVINGLEHCRRGPIGCQQECPYKSDFGCRSQLTADALELLKDQEPKPVRIKTNAYGTKHYYCPKCNEWFEKKEPYCHLCGQAVKWE